jgi:hypothetical protein
MWSRLGDTSCNVLFSDADMAARAVEALTYALPPVKRVTAAYNPWDIPTNLVDLPDYGQFRVWSQGGAAGGGAAGGLLML